MQDVSVDECLQRGALDTKATQVGQADHTGGTLQEALTTLVSSTSERLGEATQQSEKVVGPTPEELESYSELMTFQLPSVDLEKSFEASDDGGYTSSSSATTTNNVNIDNPLDNYDQFSHNEALESLLSEILQQPLKPASQDSPPCHTDTYDESFDVKSFLQANYDNDDNPSPQSLLLSPNSTLTHLNSSPLSLPSPTAFSFDEPDDYFSNSVFDFSTLNQTSQIDMLSSV